MKEEGEYFKSQVEAKLHKIKNLVNADILKKYKDIDSSDLIKHNPFNLEYEKVNEYRLEICYLIHTWSAYLSKNLRIEDDNEDQLKKILQKFDIEESKDFRNKLMIITFKMFAHEFVHFVNEGDEKGYKNLFPKLKIIVDSMNNDQSELGTDKEASIIKENFDKICFSLIKILKNNENIEKGFLQDLISILIKLIFYLGSVRLHILLLTLIQESKKKFSKVKLDLPSKLTDENLAKLPLLWVDSENKSELVFNKSEVGDIKNFDSPNENTILLHGNEHSYILNNNEKLTLLYDKTPIFKNLVYVNGISTQNCNEVYYFDGQFNALHQDEKYTGPINLNTLNVNYEGGKLDIPYGIENNVDPILKEIKDKGWNWSSYDYFFET